MEEIHMAGRRDIRTGLSYMYEPAFNRALLPLLQAGLVDALEWSFDTVRDHRQLPGWMLGLLREYSEAGRLYGHGVYYSLFSGSWDGRQEAWLRQLDRVQHDFQFCHLSEHFGFMSSGNAHRGAPLPVPFGAATLKLGQDRLRRLKAAAGIPVGVENLALAFSREEALQQGPFLEQLLAPANGFLLLDLHNLWCTAVNFGADPSGLLRSYPLERVREVHLSGGSWADASGAALPIRRDTHDEAVPEALFGLLEEAIALCPHLELVVLERLGDTLRSSQDEAGLRGEFLRIRELVRSAPQAAARSWPAGSGSEPPPPEAPSDSALARDQDCLLRILREAPDASTAQQRLRAADVDAALWQTGRWEFPMIETAMELGRKWGIEE